MTSSLSFCRFSIPDAIFTLAFPLSLLIYFSPFLFGLFPFAPPSQDTEHRYGPTVHKMSISYLILYLHILTIIIMEIGYCSTRLTFPGITGGWVTNGQYTLKGCLCPHRLQSYCLRGFGGFLLFGGNRAFMLSS